MYGNEWFLSFIESYIQINYIKFYLQQTQYTYNTRFKCNSCWGLTAYQATVYNKQSKCPASNK
jgi:hypothetical protein